MVSTSSSSCDKEVGKVCHPPPYTCKQVILSGHRCHSETYRSRVLRGVHHSGNACMHKEMRGGAHVQVHNLYRLKRVKLFHRIDRETFGLHRLKLECSQPLLSLEGGSDLLCVTAICARTNSFILVRVTGMGREFICIRVCRSLATLSICTNCHDSRQTPRPQSRSIPAPVSGRQRPPART